jgi:hypothetical protein
MMFFRFYKYTIFGFEWKNFPLKLTCFGCKNLIFKFLGRFNTLSAISFLPLFAGLERGQKRMPPLSLTQNGGA